MPSSPPPSRGRQTLHRQVQALLERVSKLERVSARNRRVSTTGPVGQSKSSDYGMAEIQARMDASQEYYDQKRLRFYREHPGLLKEALKQEREHDAFLRERGVKPRESDAKRFAKLLAQETRAPAKPRDHRSSQKLRTSNGPTSQITQTEQRIAGAKTRNH